MFEIRDARENLGAKIERLLRMAFASGHFSQYIGCGERALSKVKFKSSENITVESELDVYTFDSKFEIIEQSKRLRRFRAYCASNLRIYHILFLFPFLFSLSLPFMFIFHSTLSSSSRNFASQLFKHLSREREEERIVNALRN